MILVVVHSDKTGEVVTELARGLKTSWKARKILRGYEEPWHEARLETVVRRKDGSTYRKVRYRRTPRSIWVETRHWPKNLKQSGLPPFKTMVELLAGWVEGVVIGIPWEGVREPWPGIEPPEAGQVPADALLRRARDVEEVPDALDAIVALIYREGIFVGRMEKLADPQYRKAAKRLRELELDHEMLRRDHFTMTNELRRLKREKLFTRSEWEAYLLEERARRTLEPAFCERVAASYPARHAAAKEKRRREKARDPERPHLGKGAR